MRKILSIALALVLTLSLLAGCRNPMDNSQNTTAGTESTTNRNANRSRGIFR